MKRLNPHLRYSDLVPTMVLAFLAAQAITYALIHVVKGQ